MRDFVKFSPTFWCGPTGRLIRKSGQDAQFLGLYLLTCPHSNYIGLYMLPINYICADTSMDVARVRDALVALEICEFALYDEASETVWLIEGAKWQLGELKATNKYKKADNRVAMVRKSFAALPQDCPFLERFKEKYDKALKMTPEAETPSTTEALTFPSPPDDDDI